MVWIRNPIQIRLDDSTESKKSRVGSEFVLKGNLEPNQSSGKTGYCGILDIN
jgi:hypothetical protein